MTVFDLDDFHAGNARLDLLDQLKGKIPELKVTLFTIPMPGLPFEITFERHVEWLREARAERPWIEYAVHGWSHTYLECQRWTQADADHAIEAAERAGIFVRGFKAPYWETSDGVYRALYERGWWIADHPRNDAKRHPHLKTYLLEGADRVHGHVQDWGSNGLGEMMPFFETMRPPFQFISEVMA